MNNLIPFLKINQDIPERYNKPISNMMHSNLGSGSQGLVYHSPASDVNEVYRNLRVCPCWEALF